MKFSYENEDLFSEVIQDLAEFGANLKHEVRVADNYNY